MEGEEIGLVLARAAAPPTSAPASKISVCIAAAVARPPPQRDTEAAVKRLGVGEEEVESLIGMNNALESLERQLASLQLLCGRFGKLATKWLLRSSFQNNRLLLFSSHSHVCRGGDLFSKRRNARSLTLCFQGLKSG